MNAEDLLSSNKKLYTDDADFLLRFFEKNGYIIAFLVVALTALLLRVTMLQTISGDYTYWLRPWMQAITELGGWRSLRHEITNYSVPYTFFLSLIAHMHVEPLIPIKMFSIFFDYALAGICSLIVYKLFPKINYALLAFAAVLFCPIVFLDSAWWAQCDGIYTFFIMLSFYFILDDKPLFASFAAGLSFAVKFQMTFFLPFLIFMYLDRRFKLWHFLNIPLAYIVCSLPAIIVGRPFLNVMTIYTRQSQTYRYLSNNAPSFFRLPGVEDFSGGVHTAMFLALGVLAGLAFFILLANRKLDKKADVMLAFLSSFAMVFFLPQMHERFFYVVVIFGIIFAFQCPKLFYLPLTLMVCVLHTFIFFLLEKQLLTVFNPKVIALIVLAVFVLVAKHTITYILSLPQHSDAAVGAAEGRAVK